MFTIKLSELFVKLFCLQNFKTTIDFFVAKRYNIFWGYDYNGYEKEVKQMDRYDEVVKLCRTCEKATVLSITGDCLCKKYGVVKNNYVCKKYKLNKFLPRPPKLRNMDTARFNINDFQV